MLTNMHIKNIVLISEIDIDFGPGLNILTGETGAGKSIVIGAIGICLGGRFSKELLRDPEHDGSVELLFSVEEDAVWEKLSKLGIERDPAGEVLIQRKLTSSGRSTGRINGETVTTAMLKEAATVLLNLHAQHEQQTLLVPAEHMALLDRFGGEAIARQKQEVAECYDRYRKLSEELASLSGDAAERMKRLDFLAYQIEEIQNARLMPGEDAELEKYYKKAANAQAIEETAGEIHAITGYGDGRSAMEQIDRALASMRHLTGLDPETSGMYETLEQVSSLLSDFDRELTDYADASAYDKEALAETEARLDLVNTLKAKYGKTIEEVLDTLADMEEEQEKLSSHDESVARLKEELGKEEKKLLSLCEVLSETRKKHAKKLTDMISAALLDLNFNDVRFDMEFARTEQPTASGYDRACFMISTNVGEEMRPLSEVASGGELSRVMLAVKSTLADVEETPSMVFDEIDVGISGVTAQKVAERLSVLAKKAQVICITHLPQIAAMADHHFVIEKEVKDERTYTEIRKLSEADVIGELARMLAGAEITESTLAHAKEMKNQATERKM